MDCERLGELLLDHVDGLLGPEDADGARAHLAGCPACAALQEEVRRGFAALDSWQEEDLPAGAYERLVARLPGVRPPVLVAPAATASPAMRPALRWATLLPYGAGLATAAVVMVLALPVGGSPAGPVPAGDPSPAPPPVSVRTASPPAGVALSAEGGPGPRLLRGERALRFDADGVRRTYALPPGIDPDKVIIAVDYSRPAPEPVGGVR